MVARHSPFTIRLKDRTQEQSEVEGVQVRIDPGSRATGIAVTDEKKATRRSTQGPRDSRVLLVRRSDEVEPYRHGPCKDPHPRRPCSWFSRPRTGGRHCAHPQAGTRCHSNWTWLVRSHAARQIRLPALAPHPYQTALRLPNWRPRAGDSSVWQKSRSIHRPGRRPIQRELQRHYCARNHSGNSAQAYPPASKSRRIRLQSEARDYVRPRAGIR
ncbi:RRXRR domain-containing protein [Streptomyces sp. NPDC086549]|uniref:RRXRR domain-containing protein n=1 Tax=Streptomyces sp. NPDC086549 TaxID=3365752 RepID=UPI003823133A